MCKIFGSFHLSCLALFLLTNNGIVPALSAFITKQINLQTKWNFTEIDRLRQTLLSNYDVHVRPKPPNRTLVLQTRFSLMGLQVNELKSIVTLSIWMAIEWTDEKLRWSPDDYAGLKSIHLAHHEMWKPDLFMFNSPLSVPIALFGSRHLCLIKYTGEVLCVPSIQVNALCSLHMKYWPFDQHECEFKFGPWTRNQDTIILKAEQVEPELHLTSTNTEWKITRTTKHMEMITDEEDFRRTYHCVYLCITLARRPLAYKLIIVAPTIVVMCLLLASFWLPSNSDTRLVADVIACVISCLFLLYCMQKVPLMADASPLIVTFYSIQLLMTTFAVMETAFLMWFLSRRHSRKELPWIFRQFLEKMVVVCGVPSLSTQQSDAPNADHGNDIGPASSSSIAPSELKIPTKIHHDYIVLAAMIDRLFFLIYSAIYISLAVTYGNMQNVEQITPHISVNQ